MADKDATAIDAMGFEQALQELETIVKALESGSVSLDESINAYERGAALKRHCEKKLAEARMRVEKISLGPDGAVDANETDIG
ncbi:exodeoxyribonuclease VII small subunit [Aestuariispira ectoiniformans]|uniref:exodeoxyribonuclease VII small subunit n=1 Tax=Aestuariispira ectoiniformans TaxID=2775080 RepID=UPI00223B98D2|nr:exodeoxyribonuclease VII small subunit [Aestuariispira ectoiniformans]